MQRGSILKSRRKNGAEVWEFRWRDRASGKAIYRRIVLGTTQQFATEADARKAATCIVLEASTNDPRLKTQIITLGELTDHYRQRELTPDNIWKTYSTKAGYENYLRRWVIPKWGECSLNQIKPIEVELWLRQLPLARATCAKIRNIMSVLFNHARRYEFFDTNPITLVRQSAKRRRIPPILTADEIRRLLPVLKPLYRVLVFTDATTGLRQSELFGLKWCDLDFEHGQINVVRSVVHGAVSNCKTESSMKPIPMVPGLAGVLQDWRSQTRYGRHSDWVFASERTKGKRPMWGENMIRKPIRQAARAVRIQGAFGWHAFRHSYSTMLRFLGIDIKVQQDLLRHSSARLTLDTYTQAVTTAKQDAQNAVIQLLIGSGEMHLRAPAKIA